LDHTDDNSNGITRKFIYIGVFQVFCAVSFALILIVVAFTYGKDIILVAENLWIPIAFGCILISSSFYSIGKVIVFFKSGRWRGLRLKNIDKKTAWIIGWSIWNLLIGILLIALFIILYILLADVLSGELLFLSIFLGFIFIGNGSLLIAGGLRVFIHKIKLKKNTRILPGLTGVGFSFVFLFSSFGLTMLFYNPQWAEGVEHQEIFTAGEQEGRGYRIPAMLALPGDIVLAFCESRKDPFLDWGDIDLIMKRSIDGGKTWGSIVTLRDEGTQTAGNPCPVFENNTQTVWLPYCVDNKRVYVMNSSDYGATWSEPRVITTELGVTGTTRFIYATGPGCGIQLSTGRLIIPSYFMDSRSSHVVYSDNNGSSWQRGADLENGGECQAYEAVNGSLYLNCRTSSGYRYIGWSNDGGETWANQGFDYNLPEPACMASVHRFTTTATHTKNRVLYSGPHEYNRGHLTVKLSENEGVSWPISKEVYAGASAYSQIVILSDFTVLILFEWGRYDYREAIVLVKIDLDWIIS